MRKKAIIATRRTSSTELLLALLKDVYYMIEKAASKGEFSIIIKRCFVVLDVTCERQYDLNEYAVSFLRNKLCDAGYHVEWCSDYEGIIVSW